ncbi:MAG: IclR family transcriptional regulator [Pararhodobacter sp.]|nr:IclR family transcriptional regulator [Pararhodobacter sp.]
MMKGKPVNVLLSAVRVLRHLADADHPLRATHIARELGLTPSTCFNILQTLVHAGIIRIDPGSGGYEPDVGLIALAAGAIRRVGYRGVARAHMEDLAQCFQVTVTLWQRQGADRVVLTDYCESESPVRISMNIGQRLPFLVGALGRCMAAFDVIDAETLRKHYQELRSDNLLPFDAFLTEVELTRKRGYGLDTGQFVSGITTISAPIRDATGRPIAALSVVALSAQVPEAPHRADIGDALKEAAREIEATLPVAQLGGTGAAAPIAPALRNGADAVAHPNRQGTPDGSLPKR